MALALNVMGYAFTPWPTYCGLMIAFRYFPSANRDVVFYSVCAAVVFIYVAGVLAGTRTHVPPAYVMNTFLAVAGALAAKRTSVQRYHRGNGRVCD